MLLCDRELLIRCVARERNDLHPIEQRLRNRVCRVRRADEHDIREIIGHVHVVVGKCAVLLGIQHLKQCRRRIAVVGRADLVDLIEHHNRVRRAGLRDAVHDSAWHCADVRPSVAADISLIADAAEAHADIFASEGPRDAAADARLARAWRADEEKNRALLLLLQVHDRDLLNDSLLDLL